MTPAIWRWVQGIGTSSVLALLVLVGNFTLGVRDSMRDLPRELGRIEDRLGTQIEMIRQEVAALKRGEGIRMAPETRESLEGVDARLTRIEDRLDRLLSRRREESSAAATTPEGG